MRKILSVIVFALCASSVWAAPQTFTIAESGGDYSTLETALNAKEGNYTGVAGGSITFCIQGVWTSTDTTAVTIHNYTLGASSGILIYTASDARHDGKWDTTAYIHAGGLDASAQTGTNGYISIVGLQQQVLATRWYLYSTYNYVADCIFQQTSATNVNLHCLLMRGGGTLSNSIFYKTGGAGTGGGYDIRGGNSYNNTVHGFLGGVGVRNTTAPNTVHKNILSYNNQLDFEGSYVDASSTNNLSKDGTAPDYNVYYDSKTITFVNAAAGDFHLASTDTDAIDKGADLSSIFTTDIDGVTRIGTWDIGADEYVSAEPPAPAPSVPFLPQGLIWEN